MPRKIKTLDLEHSAIKDILSVIPNNKHKDSRSPTARMRYPWAKLQYEGEAFVVTINQYNKATRAPNSHDRVDLQRKLTAAAACASQTNECYYSVIGFDNRESGGPMGIVVIRGEDFEPWRRLGSQL